MIINNKALLTPIYIAESYLFGTFIVFLVGPLVNEASNLPLLILYICTSYLAILFGYLHGLKNCQDVNISFIKKDIRNNYPIMKMLLIASAIYFIVYGLVLLEEYEGLSLSAILQAVRDPGEAYHNKFLIYERQTAENSVNHAIQLLVLLNVFYTFAIPYAILLWERLHVTEKAFFAIAVLVYASFFVCIGTLKGLGDLFFIAFAAYLCKIIGFWKANYIKKQPARNKRIAFMVVVAASLGSYMVFNMVDRLTTIGLDNRFREISNETVTARVLGSDVALGVNMIISYPTHGYVGLSYNLETPFEWTYGLGNSMALSSYFSQYFDMPDMFESTYPARTETRTGYPAKRLWATIYPWLASDITFPGTILFMYFLGMFFAKIWIEAAFYCDKIAVIVFCQFSILIAFIPANNQLMQVRASLWSTVSLLTLYLFTRKYKYSYEQ